MLFSFSACLQGRLSILIDDYKRANDVLKNDQWPLRCGAQNKMLLEIFYRSVRYRRPFTAASTVDIEWDGD